MLSILTSKCLCSRITAVLSSALSLSTACRWRLACQQPFQESTRDARSSDGVPRPLARVLPECLRVSRSRRIVATATAVSLTASGKYSSAAQTPENPRHRPYIAINPIVRLLLGKNYSCAAQRCRRDSFCLPQFANTGPCHRHALVVLYVMPVAGPICGARVRRPLSVWGRVDLRLLLGGFCVA